MTFPLPMPAPMPADRAQRTLELVAGFDVADELERAHAAAIANLLHTAVDPFSREAFVPGHLTASAFVVDASRQHVLLILHAKLGRWLQPGGHIEPDDGDLLAAARREVQEETGLGDLQLLAAPFDLDVHSIPARKEDPAHLHFDVRFLFETAEKRATPATDATAAQWVALDAVACIDSDESVLRAVRKIMRLHRAA